MPRFLKPQVVVAKRNIFWRQFLIVAAIMAIGLVVAWMVFLPQKLDEPQETRTPATVDGGKLFLTLSPGNASDFEVDKEQTVSINLDTKGAQIDGIEIVFNIISNTLPDAPSVDFIDNAALQVVSQEVEKTSDGYLVSMSALVPPTMSFSTSGPTKIGEIKFEPTSAGSIKISFDKENTISTIRNGGGNDELQNIADVTYQAKTFVDPGTGGTTVKKCNETCSNNAECGNNLRCYDTGSGKKCRLVTNVSSESCTDPADQGLSFSCNQYCSNTGECQKGLTCYYNKCRQPENVDSTTCALPTATQKQVIANACNKACSTNKDCPANMRCYTNKCRLATNASSTSCSAYSVPTVSNTYSTKGGVATNDMGSDSLDQSVTGLDKTGTSSGQTNPYASIKPIASAQPTSQEKSVEIIEETDELTGLAKFVDMYRNYLRYGLIGLAIILGLIIISWLWSAMNSKQGQVVSPVSKMEPTKYEVDLQSKIKNLETQQNVTAPPPSTMSQMPPRPVVPTSPLVNQTSVTSQPYVDQPIQTPQTGSSMVDRLKNKGITPPGGQLT